MAIRLSGLSSGLDTESIVAELVKAKSDKKETLVKSQKKLSWKQDAWKSLNSKIYSLYSKSLSDMRLQSDYTKKKTTASSSAVSVITGADAPNSVQTMKVDQMAKAGYLTGAKLSDTKGTYTGDSKVVEALGAEAGSKFTVTVNGSAKDIEITDATTINGVVTALRDAGVNANFDEVNQRFFISAKSTGKDNDFTLTASDENGLKSMSKLGIASPLSTDSNTEALYTKYAALLDEDGNLNTEAEGYTAIFEAALAKKISGEGYAKKITDAKAAIETKTTELTTAQADFDTKFASGLQKEDGSGIETDVTKIQEAITALGEDVDAMDADTKAKYDAYTEQLNAAKNIKSIQDEITRQTDIKEAAEKYYTPGEGEEAGTATQDLIDLVKSELTTQATNSKNMLTFYSENGSMMNAIRVAGEDATITLNNETYHSTSNTFAINGLTITVNSTTAETITITTADDTDGIYDKIKGFLKEYNTLINEMDKLYNAESASKYDMLSDDEKEAMSEDDVKEWENKIKDSLLRRDSTLSTVSEAMKTIMLSGVTMKDGSKMYLSDLGIGTLGYFNSAENEKNAYHIDGDSDDESTSTKTDKLKGMIANDPQKVSEFFATLSRTLYEKLDDLMESTDYSSAFTVYNDKQMKTEYDAYKTKIADQEEKIADYEDAYYKKFTAMETAMAKLNSQQSSLSSLFGS